MQTCSLVGRLVSEIESDKDSVRLIFSDGAWIRIFNRLSLDGGRIEDVKSKAIMAVTQRVDVVEFDFEGGGRILVGMEESDYCGPEAMILREPDGQIVVWN